VRLVLRFVSVEELANFYQAADVVVYPYTEVTTSGALMTGIAYGKAIVASALPAFQELLRHEQNALLVPCKDVEALADSLVRLAGDAELRERLARQLQQDQAAAPSWADIAQHTFKCYYAMVHSRGVGTVELVEC
jgi:glycosyltransferase involved in cell wall biosynthesis